MIPYERETSTRQAKKYLREAYRECGVQPPYLQKKAKGQVYLALDSETRTKAQGAGKGKFAEIGALAECLEHHVYENYSSPFSKDLKISKLCEQDYLRNDPTIQLVESYKGQSLSCSPWGYNGETIWIPDALVQTDIVTTTSAPETILSRYSTNSGVSYGSTFRESILHGVLEVIERHFVSEIFYSVIFSKNVLGMNYLEKESKSGNFDTLYVEGYNHVSVAICIERNAPIGALPIISSGASFEASHAISRAETEYIQLKSVENEETIQEDFQVLKNLKSDKGLSKLIDISIKDFNKSLKKNLGENELEFEEIWEKVLDVLREFNFASRTIYSGKLGQHIVQVYSPKLSRFNLIRQGNFVAPLHFLD